MRNKVVVITGGGRGIGKALAKGCLETGAQVVIASRTASELESAISDLKPFGSIHAVRCDVSKQEDVDRLFDEAKKLGPLYGLICAAGIYGPIGNFEENSLAEWEKTFSINVMGTVRCVHAAIPQMKAQSEGRILLFSGGGQGAMARFSAYVTSKGAIWRLTETLGAELAPHGIYVNAIAPGAVNTKLLDDLIAAGPEKAGEEVYKRSLKQKEEGGTSPEKAVKLTQYLLSDKSRGLSGKILSAIWDPYEKFENLEKLSHSDIFTVRRVVDEKGATRN